MQRAERLLNLMIYLLAARSPVTASDVRFDVEGYGDAASDEAFARMFERDKDDLRRAGVPILTEADISGETGYRIDRGAYYLPPLNLSPAELAAVSLASTALMADPGFPMREDLRHAFLKLSTQSQSPDPAAGEVRVRLLGDKNVRAETERVSSIWGAVSARKRVRFHYSSMSSGRTKMREIEAYGLYYSAGAWYAVGRDVGLGEVRTFRLSRVVGAVEVNKRAPRRPDYEIPSDFDVRRQGMRPWEMGHSDGEATVRFSPRVAWMAEREVAGSGEFTYEKDGSGTWKLARADHEGLVRWLLGLGDQAEVISPPKARARIRRIIADALDAGGV